MIREWARRSVYYPRIGILSELPDTFRRFIPESSYSQSRQRDLDKLQSGGGDGAEGAGWAGPGAGPGLAPAQARILVIKFCAELRLAYSIVRVFAAKSTIGRRELHRHYA